jgi:hypothetical protein
MSGVVHPAGLDVSIGPLLRQRCAWCGTVLVDVDLAATASTGGASYPTWPVGALVEIDGGVSFTVDPVPSAESEGVTVPDNCCMKLDPDVTR